MKIELNSRHTIHELIATDGNAVIKEDIGTYDGLIPTEYGNDMLYLANEIYHINNKYNSDVDFVSWAAKKFLNEKEIKSLVENLQEDEE